MTDGEWKNSFCRACQAYCGIRVRVEDGVAVEVRGDPAHPMTGGYTCPKGRALPEQHTYPGRLLASQRKRGTTYEGVASAEALDEIAARLSALVATQGPASVAVYLGTQGWHSSIYPIVRAWLAGIGSPMFYTSATIDQPGKQIAAIRHGTWAAGNQPFNSSEAFMMVGCNPLISMWSATRFPVYNPARRLRDAIARGMKLIVVDPRRSDVAKLATFHLQVVPGEDAALLAAMIHVILSEGLYDGDLCSSYVGGLEDLRSAVSVFSPTAVAERTGVPASQIAEAARAFAAAKTGMATSGTGPSMAPHGNLSEQLVLVLNSICGRYPRAGDPVPNPGTLTPLQPRFAEPIPGRKVRIAIESAVAGVGALEQPGPPEMPTTTLADQILTPGPQQVRALIVVGGNPVAAFPDQDRTLRALDALDLSVTIDITMSATARRCDYVIAPRLQFERADCTAFFDSWHPAPFAQYTPALVQAPGDVLSEAEFFWGLATRMDTPIQLPGGTTPLDRCPTDDELLDLVVHNPRVPLDIVRQHPSGAIFPPDEPQRVQPRRSESQARLNVGEAALLAELSDVASERPVSDALDPFPFRLVSRRLREASNSSMRDLTSVQTQVGRYNAANMHPDDIAGLCMSPGSEVIIRSRHGEILAVLAEDPGLRTGVVSMAHGFGDAPSEDGRFREIGSPTNRLVGFDEQVDAHTRMPVQSAVPVAVERLRQGQRPA